MTWQRGKSVWKGTRTELDGITFHSNAEAMEYAKLKQMQDMGLIDNLKLQVPFRLFGIGGTEIGVYTVDFTYTDGGLNVAHESKARSEKVFEMRLKLFKDNYPGWVFRITGDYQKIKDRANKKSRAKYAQKKMLAMMGDKA